jgi:hypothetical protein
MSITNISQKVDQQKWDINWDLIFSKSEKTEESEEKEDEDDSKGYVVRKKKGAALKDTPDAIPPPKIFKTSDGSFVTRTPIIGDRKADKDNKKC